jgi:hydroxymethylbilane synthase
MQKKLLIGTRGSKLALWQTEWVIKCLKEKHRDIDFLPVKIKTTGDQFAKASLVQAGGMGLFTKELELALLKGEIDLAVHSLKDLPTQLPTGLVLLAVCPRGNAADALVSRTGLALGSLPKNAVIGTSSLRRAAQLLYYRPDFRIVPLRGNIDRRLKKMDEQKLDGIVIAVAGLQRLGLAKNITEIIPFSICLPAAAQGAIGIEGRAGDSRVAQIAFSLNHPSSNATVTAERAFLRKLGVGCQYPIGVLGEVEGDKLTITGMVASENGKQLVRNTITGKVTEATWLGETLAEKFHSRGVWPYAWQK